MYWLTHRALWSASLPQSEGNAALLNNQRRKPSSFLPIEA